MADPSTVPASTVPALGKWVDAWRRRVGTAFSFEGDAVSYPELAARVDATVAGLADLGIVRGDRVAFCGLNRVEIFDALFACARLGAILCPLNNRLAAVELCHLLADAEPSVVLTTDGFAGPLAAATEAPIRDLDLDPFPAAASRSDVGAIDDPVLMMFTSGTTGVSKGAVLTQRALAYTSLNGLDHQGITASDVILAPLPTFHVGGLNIQTLPALEVGAQVILERRFDPERVLTLLATRGVTQTLLVPAMLTAVAAQPGFGEADLSSLIGVNTGSSVVPDAVTRPWFDKGIPVGQVYGATETGPTSVVLGYDEAAEHPGSCGRPARYTELRVVTAEGADAAPGVAGEVWLRGPNLFSHYWNRPVETAASHAEGWYRTGDVGHLDAEGYLFISDRLGDMIISGGENIYPAELEAVLIEHPAIVEVAVIGRPDQQWGETPVAVVVAAEGQALTIDGLRDWAGDRLARYKLPRGLAFVDALPRTALGKVQKHILRDQLGFAHRA